MILKWAAVLGAGLLAVQVSISQTPTLKTDKEKLSYALGMDLGKQFRTQSVEIDPDLFRQGLGDALSGGKTLLTEEEVRAAIASLQEKLKQKQMALQEEKITAMKQLAEKNQKDGEAFLILNKAKPGVVTLPSGLQYKIVKAGGGKTPGIEDMVVCHYRGTLIDGTEFDSSYKRNEPLTLPVKGVIKGWIEALLLMPVGSRWQLFIPASLAYGERGAGAVIGPNAVLVFELELISIQDKS
jgi:FKBP-type peptidyl-prolyl cis-trans isomerase FklB